MTRIKSCVRDELSSGCNAIFTYAIAIAIAIAIQDTSISEDLGKDSRRYRRLGLLARHVIWRAHDDQDERVVTGSEG